MAPPLEVVPKSRLVFPPEKKLKQHKTAPVAELPGMIVVFEKKPSWLFNGGEVVETSGGCILVDPKRSLAY